MQNGISATRTIRQQLVEAFERPADASGIFQGKRRFRTGLPHVRVVQFSSRKNGGLISCEGSLEEKAAVCLELDPEINAFRPQPIDMPGPRNGVMVPDFVAQLGHFYAIIDIKAEGRLRSARVTERMRHIREQLEEAGIPHYLFTEKFLERQPLLQIRTQLRKGLHIELKPHQTQHLLESVRDSPVTVQALRQSATRLGIHPHAVEHLASSNRLHFCITTNWTENTLVGGHQHESRDTTLPGWGTVRDLCFPL